MSPGGGQTNPVCSCLGYREEFFAAARSLETLDGATAPGAASSRSAASGVVGDVGGAGIVSAGTHGPARGQEQVVAQTAVPEEVVPMPRFNAIADRFRRQRLRQKVLVTQHGKNCENHAKEEEAEGEEQKQEQEQEQQESQKGECDRERLEGDDVTGGYGSRVGQSLVSVVAEPTVGSWKYVEGEHEREDERDSGSASEEDIREGRNELVENAGMHPENTTNVGGVAGRGGNSDGRARRRRGGSGGGSGGDIDNEEEVIMFDGRGSARRGEDGGEEQGLLRRLRSVAQEARLEVMDSRLQDLHVSDAVLSVEGRVGEKACSGVGDKRELASKARPIDSTEYAYGRLIS